MTVAESVGWSFVGRDAELAHLRQVLDGSGAVVLAGEAGVGKSRLVRELVGQAVTNGARGAGIATASHSASEIPLAALVPLLPLAGGLGPASGGHVSDAAQEAATGSPSEVLVLQGALAALRGLEVLLVDDAHHLDRVSATVLQQLVASGGVRVVVTVRTGVPAPDAVTSLWKDGSVERVELSALSSEQTAVLLTEVLGGSVDSTAHRRLFAITRGNLLWLRHLVDGERAAGRLVRVGEAWSWLGQPELSPMLEELVVAQIGRLSEPERRVLELVACDEPLELAVLEDLAGAEAVEQAAQRDLITLEADGTRWQVRLGHPLYGEVARRWMRGPRVRRVRGELAAALDATGGRRTGDGLRRAVLGLGSDRPGDPALFGTAAAQAVALGDPELGLRLFRAARDAGGGFEAQIALGSLTGWMFGGEQAEIELAHAMTLAATPAEQARTIQARAFNLYTLVARPTDAQALLETSSRLDLGTAAVDLNGIRALLAVMGNDIPRARRCARTVLEDPGSSWAARAVAGWSSVLVQAFAGQAREIAATAATATHAAGQASETSALRANIGFAAVFGLCLDGRIAPARGIADRTRSGQGDAAAAFATYYDGRIALDTGRGRTALRCLVSLRPLFPGHGGGHTTWIELMAAAAAAMIGDVDAAQDALGRAHDNRHPGMPLFAPQLGWARGWVAAAQGALTEALATLGGAAAEARTGRQHAIEMLVRHTAVCFGDRSQAARLAELAGLIDGPRAVAAAAHAAAWADRDPGALLAVAEQLEDLELLLFAADATAQASTVLVDAGRVPEAAIASARGAELARRCEDARTPALLAAASPVVVTAREREVATLAAAGLTNRQVAERLGLSMRTVESVVYQACRRLGLADRAEFVTAVVPRPT